MNGAVIYSWRKLNDS